MSLTGSKKQEESLVIEKKYKNTPLQAAGVFFLLVSIRG
jgi:hypothetical protein